jgi:hypothetical protein
MLCHVLKFGSSDLRSGGFQPLETGAGCSRYEAQGHRNRIPPASDFLGIPGNRLIFLRDIRAEENRRLPADGDELAFLMGGVFHRSPSDVPDFGRSILDSAFLGALRWNFGWRQIPPGDRSGLIRGSRSLLSIRKVPLGLFRGQDRGAIERSPRLRVPCSECSVNVVVICRVARNAVNLFVIERDVTCFAGWRCQGVAFATSGDPVGWHALTEGRRKGVASVSGRCVFASARRADLSGASSDVRHALSS